MILPLAAEHIKAVAEIEQLCFSDAWSEKSLRDTLRNPYANFFVYIDSEKVAGYMGMYAVSGEGSVTNVATHPDFRQKGIAFALVENMKSIGEALGLEYITLEVRESNASARRLYEKCGFRTMGVRKSFYSHPKEDALIMNYFFEKDNCLENTCN